MFILSSLYGHLCFIHLRRIKPKKINTRKKILNAGPDSYVAAVAAEASHAVQLTVWRLFQRCVMRAYSPQPSGLRPFTVFARRGGGGGDGGGLET